MANVEQSNKYKDVLRPRWQMKAFSIRQLLAFVTTAALAPMIVFGVVALVLWDGHERAVDNARLAQHAESLSQAVDREIRTYRDVVEGLATSPDLQSGQTAAFRRYAQGVANHLGGHFALINPALQQVVNTTLPPDSPLPSAQATEAIRRVLSTGKTFITDFQSRSATGEFQFTILAPVSNNGAVSFVLGYAPPAQAIQNVVMQSYRPDSWLAAVLDRNGVIVARSEAFQEFFGRPASASFLSALGPATGSMESIDLQGRASMTAWHTNQNGWKVLVWAPKVVLEQRSRYAVQALAFAALATILISMLAFWLASRIIRDPARRLVDAAISLGEGQIVHFTPTNMKEANAIGASLSQASALIHRREADLLASQAHTNLIMRELSHRSKNLLAIIQAIARQSARASANFADFQPRFIERLQSLSMSHDLLVKTDWTSVPIRDLVAVQMRTFVDQPETRLRITGDHLMLKPEAAQNLGMLFHELGSNAVKHGSLSTPGGIVHIDWRIDERPAPTLELRWREEGGPPVRPPTARGFGSTIIERLIPQSLQGEATSEWNEQGFMWTLRAPMTSIVRAGKYTTAPPLRQASPSLKAAHDFLRHP
jgi:two-component sensor histidine kinase